MNVPLANFNVGRGRFDQEFSRLALQAEEKGLKLHRNCFCMGYVLKYPNGSKTNFKSFSKLKDTIHEYNAATQNQP